MRPRRYLVVELDPSLPATSTAQPIVMTCTSISEAAYAAIGLGASGGRHAAWIDGEVDPVYVSEHGRLYRVDCAGRPHRVDHVDACAWN